MENEELIKEFENFLITDIEYHPIIVKDEPGHLQVTVFVMFDIKNEIPKGTKFLYLPITSIIQGKEVFKYFCDRYQCGAFTTDYDKDFDVNLASMKFDRKSNLFLSIFHDNRVKI